MFNLIPAFPLDGGRVLRAVLWNWKKNIRWATQVASRIGSGFGMVLIVLGIVRVITGDFLGGMWSFLIGSFLRNAATMSYQQVALREALRGMSVGRFMKTDVITVPREISVADLVENYFYKHHFKMFPVLADGKLAGCVTTKDVSNLRREEWPRQTVGTIAGRCTEENSVPPTMDAVDALSRMNRTGASRLLVAENSRLVGILTLKDLLRFLSLKIELEEKVAASGAHAALGRGLSSWAVAFEEEMS
ncbi:MAG: CBS domain-containing protein [Acidobacteriota bacterium]|nr:CBS domain-containing protein [Acidobacteriota bacterium]